MLCSILYFIIINAASAAIVTITMDDDYGGQYKYAYPILHERNINATAFVFTANIGKTAGNGTITFLTIPQMKEMRDAGWEIAAHTITHPDLTTLNNSQIEYELSGSKAYLVANGFDIKTFAYPYGKYNDNATRIAKKYFVIARTTDQGINPIPLSITSFNLEGRGVERYNEAVIEGWIDEAIANNQWLILYFHNINANGYIDTSVTEGGQNLTVIANYIKSKVDRGQLKALTFYQGWLEATQMQPLTIKTQTPTVTASPPVPPTLTASPPVPPNLTAPAPRTFGFEAVFAIGGLLVVAYILKKID